ncbi:STM4015 family protein [Flavobacterium oreochromis]|uniref:STM4015 family protein n=1 Tax=Flavobacterium oreochromis TaxID=2906078 RepID=A0ABW8PBT7_9FLAO|nr:STM4015 family protein [Flavobacterium oreochromis]
MISENLEQFNGKKVIDFNPKETLKDLTKYCYRIRIDYDDYEAGKKVVDLIDAFTSQSSTSTCEDLIIGAWDFEMDEDTSAEIVHQLASLKDHFKNLKALCFGDITYEEQEISWIQQCDVSPLLASFPALELFQVRGGEGLGISSLSHANLKTLIIETGGLSSNVIEDISNSNLPQLEKLEVWLGSNYYGFESTIEDLKTIIEGKIFPKLNYFGLKNSIIQDEIAIAISKSPLLNQLEVLDLSMGTLSDEGAQALVESAAIKNLKFLNLNHHYMTDDMVEKIKSLGIPVDVEGQEEEEEGYKYIEVAE